MTIEKTLATLVAVAILLVVGGVGCSKSTSTGLEPMVEIAINGGKAFKTAIPGDNGGIEILSVEIYFQIQKSDQKEFERRYKKCEQELSDRIMVILKSSTTSERMEPVTIREKIKQSANEVLGTLQIKQVFFINFSLDRDA